MTDRWVNVGDDVWELRPSRLVCVLVYRSEAKGRWYARLNDVTVLFPRGLETREKVMAEAVRSVRRRLLDTLNELE